MTHYRLVGAYEIYVTHLSYYKLTNKAHNGTLQPRNQSCVTYGCLADGTMAWLDGIANQHGLRRESYSAVYMDWDRIGHWIFHQPGRVPCIGWNLFLLVAAEIEGGPSYLNLWLA